MNNGAEPSNRMNQAETAQSGFDTGSPTSRGHVDPGVYQDLSFLSEFPFVLATFCLVFVI